MRKESNDPYGYKKLLAYTKAEQLLEACTEFTSHFPPYSHSKTLSALQDQMDRSARSVKQNIVEGWMRNSTKEYHQFLGFSLGANAELEEDCNDVIKGMYAMGGKGIQKGEMGIEEVETLRFYPIDSHLPPIVQLKLRCKELNFLLLKLQQSLQDKMTDGTKVMNSAWGSNERGKGGDIWFTQELEKQGLIRLPDGRVVPKDSPDSTPSTP